LAKRRKLFGTNRGAGFSKWLYSRRDGLKQRCCDIRRGWRGGTIAVKLAQHDSSLTILARTTGKADMIAKKIARF
jgi:hypothetical protein